MPTIDIQISDVKRNKDNVTFIATTGNKVIERTLNISDVDNWNDFANWLINQEPDFELLPDKEKSLVIDWHNETFTDPETELEVTVKIVDNVVVT